eukprot:5765580-Pyramimonas_sp.AAC.1
MGGIGGGAHQRRARPGSSGMLVGDGWIQRRRTRLGWVAPSHVENYVSKLACQGAVGRYEWRAARA